MHDKVGTQPAKQSVTGEEMAEPNLRPNVWQRHSCAVPSFDLLASLLTTTLRLRATGGPTLPRMLEGAAPEWLGGLAPA